MTVNWDTDKLVEEVNKAANRAVFNATEAVLANAIRKILSGDKSGRIYVKRGGIKHQASAPGEAPASDTGRLVQSGRTEYDTENMTGSAIFSTAYAAALEFGRLDKSIAPRPYARPALAEEAKGFESGVSAEVSAAIDANKDGKK